jgi:hypothetical protein
VSREVLRMMRSVPDPERNESVRSGATSDVGHESRPGQKPAGCFPHQKRAAVGIEGRLRCEASSSVRHSRCVDGCGDRRQYPAIARPRQIDRSVGRSPCAHRSDRPKRRTVALRASVCSDRRAQAPVREPPMRARAKRVYGPRWPDSSDESGGQAGPRQLLIISVNSGVQE